MPKSATGLLQQWQFLPRDTPPGNHCIHQNKYPVQNDEYNHRNSLQGNLKEGTGHYAIYMYLKNL